MSNKDKNYNALDKCEDVIIYKLRTVQKNRLLCEAD